MESDSCIYCKIASKEAPSYALYEDEHSMAFLDIHPLSPGHTLVIPKVHARTLTELPNAEVAPLFSAVQHMARKLADALGTPDATIGINQGDSAGQAVPHLHVHIFPRFPDDKGGTVHGIVNNPPKLSLQEMVELINKQK